MTALFQRSVVIPYLNKKEKSMKAIIPVAGLGTRMYTGNKSDSKRNVNACGQTTDSICCE